MFLSTYSEYEYVEFYRALIGEIDDEADQRLDFTDIKAEPLNSVIH